MISEDLKRLLSQTESLPVEPTLWVSLQREIEPQNADMAQVAEIISRDMGMTSKILQLVNSAYFGRMRRISDPHEAVVFIGLEALKSLVLAYQIFGQYEGTRLPRPFHHGLWRHSLRTGLMAQSIARHENRDKDFVSDAFTAGLLHDAGKLVLMADDPRGYTEIVNCSQEEDTPLWRLERQALSATHSDVGGYLFWLWELPATIVEAIANHHRPQEVRWRELSTVAAVHVANNLARRGADEPVIGRGGDLELAYLQANQPANRLDQWREVCESAGEIPLDEEAPGKL